MSKADTWTPHPGGDVQEREALFFFFFSAPWKSVHSICTTPCLFYLLQSLPIEDSHLESLCHTLLIHAEGSDTQNYQKWPQKLMSRLSHLFLFTDSHPHGMSPPAALQPSHIIVLPRTPQWVASAQFFGNLTEHVAPGPCPWWGWRETPFLFLPPTWLWRKCQLMSYRPQKNIYSPEIFRNLQRNLQTPSVKDFMQQRFA